VLTVCLMNLLQKTSLSYPVFYFLCNKYHFEMNEKLKREDTKKILNVKLETKTLLGGPLVKLEWREREMHVLFHCCLR
jgi:hypothetical protein